MVTSAWPSIVVSRVIHFPEGMPVFPEGMGPQRVQVPEVYAPWSKVFFFDAGFGNVALALKLAKRCIHCVCVVKQAFCGFPHAWITEKMMKAPMTSGKTGMPSGT